MAPANNNESSSSLCMLFTSYFLVTVTCNFLFYFCIESDIYELSNSKMNSWVDRGMLSQAVHPPTTEHVYAQWQEREELMSRPPLRLLQEDNEESLDVKEEEAVSPMSGELISRNHFKTSRAVRLKLKGNTVTSGEGIMKFETLLYCYTVVGLVMFTFAYPLGKKGRLSKTDVDTGWSKDDERQCSLCQKYGDLKPNVSNVLNPNKS